MRVIATNANNKKAFEKFNWTYLLSSLVRMINRYSTCHSVIVKKALFAARFLITFV